MRKGSRGASWVLLVPAVTFLVGLGLGVVLTAAWTGGGVSTAAGTATPPTPSTTPTAPASSPSPPPVTASAVTIPAACVQAGQDARQALDLASRAWDAARGADLSGLADTLGQADSLRSLLESRLADCRRATAGAAAPGTAAGTPGPQTTPAP